MQELLSSCIDCFDVEVGEGRRDESDTLADFADLVRTQQLHLEDYEKGGARLAHAERVQVLLPGDANDDGVESAL